MISRTAEYALRAVVCLADRAAVPLTTERVAEVTQVPAGYLCKVLQALGRAGLVVSRPGLHGGFILGRPAENMSVLDGHNSRSPSIRRHVGGKKQGSQGSWPRGFGPCIAVLPRKRISSASSARG